MPWGWLHVTGHEHAPCVRDVVSPANAESPGRSGCCVTCPNEAQARQYVTRIARQSGYRPAYRARDCGRHRERPILPRIPGAGVPMECAPPLAVPQPDGGKIPCGSRKCGRPLRDCVVASNDPCATTLSFRRGWIRSPSSSHSRSPWMIGRRSTGLAPIMSGSHSRGLGINHASMAGEGIGTELLWGGGGWGFTKARGAIFTSVCTVCQLSRWA